MIPQSFQSRARRERQGVDAGVGTTDPDLSRESASQSRHPKKRQFGPDGFLVPRQKRQLPEAPPVVAIVVSLDPILPHR